MSEHSNAALRVAIVEDEGLYRDLLATALPEHSNVQVIGSFADSDAALQGIPALTPDAIILDVDLPGSMDGIQLGLALRKQLASVGIVILSNYPFPQLLSGLPEEVVGGWCYLLKRSVGEIAILIRALHSALAGEIMIDHTLLAQRRPRQGSLLERLTPRQRDVLELIAEGYTNHGIADALALNEKSIEKYIGDLYQQLDIDSHDTRVQPRVRSVLLYLQETRGTGAVRLKPRGVDA